MTTQNRIRQWLNKVAERGGHVEQEDACFLMVQVRHLIEEGNNRNPYRTAQFYADWIVHPKLDRSEPCLEILRDITGVLAENWGHTKKDITVEVSKVIALSRLKAELIALFRAHDLPIEPFDIPENWQGLAGLIVSFLINKPIAFSTENPSRRAREIREEMMAIPKPANFWVGNLLIIDLENAPHWCVQLGGDKEVRIIGLLTLR